jgi:NADPH:quinone reductase-like Zn-dependent oxidoreductase
MKAALITGYGNDVELADVARPELPDDSVMVEVHAASINPIDSIVMQGLKKDVLDYDMPWIVGYDVAGVVVEVGASASKFSVGDRVFARADDMQAGADPCRFGRGRHAGDPVRQALGRLGEPCDVVFDMLGGDTLERSFEVVKPGGRVVSTPPTGSPTRRAPRSHGSSCPRTVNSSPKWPRWSRPAR